MSVLCPEGHRSESTDYCDICGSPIGGATVTPAAGAASGSGAVSGSSASSSLVRATGPDVSPLDLSATQTCPFCGGLNVQDALFCEECGYDFTTGTPPMGSEPGPVADLDEADAEIEDEPEVEAEAQTDDVDQEPDAADNEPDEADIDDRATPDEEAGAQEPGDKPAIDDPPPAPDADGEHADGEHDDGEHGQQEQDEQDEQEQDEPPAAPAPPTRRARHTPPSRALTSTWVVEVWIDPDWYAAQQTEEACPSAGIPDIVVLTRSTALIGRPSGSRGVRPDVDAGADSAVSRRHAQLTSDGQRWWIEDLGSSNGTFVGTIGEPVPPTPIPTGQRVEIDRDDRIYIGAWTRLVLRQATESEKAGQG